MSLKSRAEHSRMVMIRSARFFCFGVSSIHAHWVGLITTKLACRWTALQMHPNTMQQVCFYNASLADTVNGNLRLRTTNTSVVGKFFERDGTISTFTRPYSSAMLQSWNKFCYTEGVIEMSAQLPGRARQVRCRYTAHSCPPNRR
eukprot:SAG31_NODE_4244_length_3423_cov_1.807461_2_plen_145_part_00